MSRWVEIASQGDVFTEKFFETLQLVNSCYPKSVHTVVRLQATQRGRVLRNQIAERIRKTTLVQSLYRGRKARVELRRLESQLRQKQRIDYFNMMATRIQSAFRGYHVRRYVCHFAERKAYLKAIKEKNEEMRSILHAYGDARRREDAEQERHAQLHELRDMAGALHHLVGTKAQPGVFNVAGMGPSTVGVIPVEDVLREETSAMLREGFVPDATRKLRIKQYHEKEKQRLLEHLDEQMIRTQGPFPAPSQLLKETRHPTLRMQEKYGYVDKEKSLDRSAARALRRQLHSGELRTSKPTKDEHPGYLSLMEPYEKPKDTFIQPQPRKWLHGKFKHNTKRSDVFDGPPAL